MKPELFRALINEAVLHLVRHDRSRHGLSADGALISEISRSNPSWARKKSDNLDFSTGYPTLSKDYNKNICPLCALQNSPNYPRLYRI
jgi:hypothetical protein